MQNLNKKVPTQIIVLIKMKEDQNQKVKKERINRLTKEHINELNICRNLLERQKYLQL